MENNADRSSAKRRQRSADRTEVMLMAAVEHDGTCTPVHVTNLSGNGSAIARGAIPPKDAWITFRRKDIARRARVVWARDGRAGLHFEEKLNIAQILTPIAGRTLRLLHQTSRCLDEHTRP